MLPTRNPPKGYDPEGRTSTLAEPTEIGRLLGDDCAPTGLRPGEDPDTEACGLCVLLGEEIRRSPLVEATAPEVFGDGSDPVPTGRSA